MNMVRIRKLMIRSMMVGCWIGLLALFLLMGSSDDEGADGAAKQNCICQEQVLRILVWGDLFDPLYIRKFEEETGITVHMSSYDSNEELIVKLKASDGKGYDLIAPSDYAVKILHDEGLLRSFDRARMPFFADLNPLLLGHTFDPDNSVSIPYEWEVYGIAYDKSFFVERPELPFVHSLSMLFTDPQGAYRVIASSDALEMFRIAAHYLFGKVDTLTDEQSVQVVALLRAQHGWVEAYTRSNLDYYLTAGYSPLAFASSAYVGRRKKFAHKIGFFVPREGGILTIENLAIPRGCAHEDLVYKFLKFIYSPASMSHHFDLLTYFPATRTVAEPQILDPEIRRLRTMSREEFEKLIFVKQIISEELMNHYWVAIKS